MYCFCCVRHLCQSNVLTTRPGPEKGVLQSGSYGTSSLLSYVLPHVSLNVGEIIPGGAGVLGLRVGFRSQVYLSHCVEAVLGFYTIQYSTVGLVMRGAPGSVFVHTKQKEGVLFCGFGSKCVRSLSQCVIFS